MYVPGTWYVYIFCCTEYFGTSHPSFVSLAPLRRCSHALLTHRRCHLRFASRAPRVFSLPVPCTCRSAERWCGLVCSGRRQQAGAQPERAVRSHGRLRRGLLVLHRQQNLGHQVGRVLPVRLPPRTKEVHQGDEDGVRGDQEASRAEGPHRLPQGVNRIIPFFT